jgi:hypothetical protein
MNIRNQIHTDSKMIVAGRNLIKRFATLTAPLGESFWFCLSFLLFLVMGPFSVFAVVIGLWSLAKGEHVHGMVEPASC